MAERVVDLLEIVEIHDQQRALTLAPPRVGERVTQTVHQHRAVGQAREPIVKRLVSQGGGGDSLVGDVFHDDPDGIGCETERVQREHEIVGCLTERGAVDSQGFASLQYLAQVRLDLTAAAQQRRRSAVDHVGSGATQQRQRIGVGVDDHEVGVLRVVAPAGAGGAKHDDADGQVLDDHAVATVLVLGLELLGDVEHHAPQAVDGAPRIALAANVLGDVHCLALGVEHSVAQLEHGAGELTPSEFLEHAFPIADVDVVGPVTPRRPLVGREAQDAVGVARDEMTGKPTGRALPHEGIDAVEQRTVAVALFPLVVCDAGHEIGDDRRREAVDGDDHDGLVAGDGTRRDQDGAAQGKRDIGTPHAHCRGVGHGGDGDER